MEQRKCPKCGSDEFHADGDFGWDLDDWRKGVVWAHCRCRDCGAEYVLAYSLTEVYECGPEDR